MKVVPPAYLASLSGWVLKEYFKKPVPDTEIVVLHKENPNTGDEEYVKVEIVYRGKEKPHQPL